MPILNMIAQGSGGGGGGSNVGEPTNLFALVSSRTSVDITWTDNNLQAIPPSTFQKSVLVRKVGSAPTTPSDGTTVVTETVMNTYQNSPYTDTGLTEGTTYYYQVFSYSTDGGITYGTPVSATPTNEWQPDAIRTLLYYKFDNNLDDSSGNGNNGTGSSGITYSLFSGSSTDYMLNSSGGLITTPLTQSDVFNHAFTLAVRVKKNDSSSLLRISYKTFSSSCVDIQYEFYNDFSGLQWYMEYAGTPRLSFPMADPGVGVWKHIVFAGDGVNQIKAYIDGVEVQPYSNYNPTFNYNVPANILVFCSDQSGNEISMDNLILENVCRSSSEVSDYFNSTKTIHGL